LPPQIRVTIHEGLAYLAMRHVQLGLQRHRTVIRHLKVLAEMLPASFRFNSKAGSWSLDPNTLNVDEAITFLTNALYRNASLDSEATEELKLLARRDLARAYTLQGDFISAQREYFHLLKLTPTDFGLAFHLRQLTAQVFSLSVPSLTYFWHRSHSPLESLPQRLKLF
jgi:tetratricopeptide (TPR) repeat protein